jgi:hypothetical protein
LLFPLHCTNWHYRIWDAGYPTVLFYLHTGNYVNSFVLNVWV